MLCEPNMEEEGCDAVGAGVAGGALGVGGGGGGACGTLCWARARLPVAVGVLGALESPL